MSLLRSFLFFMTVTLSVLSSVLVVKLSQASEPSDANSFILDGASYTRSSLVSDFLSISVSDYFGSQNMQERLDVFERLYGDDPESKKTNNLNLANNYYPWLSDFLYPEPIPKHSVVHKWAGNLSVGIGWPRYNLSTQATLAANGQSSSYFEGINQGAFQDFYDSVQKSAPHILASLGKMHIDIYAPDDSRDLTKDYARIRILPIENAYMGQSLKFSSSDLKQSGLYMKTILFDVEPLLWTAIPFTPSAGGHVDGYFLPNPDGTIGMAVCKINADTRGALLDALVSECLIRSLGLPNVSKIDGPGLLAEIIPQGDKVLGPDILQQPTEYDLFMASLLYCSDIKSGMDRNEILQVLATQNVCFEKLSK